MTELYYEKYEGEMFFDIENCNFGSEEYSFELRAEHNGQTVAVKVAVPVVVRRSLFKTIKFVKPSGQIKFSSVGEESDRFICALEQLYKPPFRSSKKFSEQTETLDFSVLNREMYELDSDKIYLKLFNDEDQSDFDEDEKINIELNFSFNFASKRASLIEVRDGYSADIVAVLMK